MVTKIKAWEYQKGQWDPYGEISIYRLSVGKEEEPSERPATLVLHDGETHERVFTESEVRAMLLEISENQHSYQGDMDIVEMHDVEDVFAKYGITLDPA